ncbi:MAG: protein kinase [Myxococcales bacterium]|nr:protein kinase [Myxococcales bacterium]
MSQASSETLQALAGIRRVSASAAELGPETLLDHRYQITDIIGEGGFGLVYGAVDTKRQRDVAIKVLALSYGNGGTDVIGRFVREAEITSSLVHGNTIRVFDWGITHDGQLFLIMERLYGEPLHSSLERAEKEKRTLGDHETRAIGVQVLQSLAEAHAHGLVHRDLKPGNIFLHRLADRAQMIKVIDFGIARQQGSELTRAGQALGTPTHMSPEQAQGMTIDGRSDLYALGVVLYECLVGRVPYVDKSSALLTMMMHVTAPVPKVCDDAPQPVSPQLAAVVERALAKSPDDRFSNATEMRDALKAIKLADLPRVRSRRSATRATKPRQSKKPRRLPRRVSDIVSGRNRPRPKIKPLSEQSRASAHASEAPSGTDSNSQSSSPPPSAVPTSAPGSGLPAARSRTTSGLKNQKKSSKSPPVEAVDASPTSASDPPAKDANDKVSRRKRRELLHAAETQRLSEEDL